MKYLYVIVRTFSAFGVPPLRRLRNVIYSIYFNASGIRVSDRVLIITAHANPHAFIKIGACAEFGRDAYIDYSGGCEIGDNVAISEGAKIFTHNHEIKNGKSNWHHNPIVFSELIIESDSWIGAGAIVLPRVRRIARGSIIGAGSVLAQDTEEYGIYAGNPAVKIGARVIFDSNNT